MPCVVPFVAPHRRVDPEPDPEPVPPRAELMALINNLQIITLRRPAALKVCARVAQHYVDYLRRHEA